MITLHSQIKQNNLYFFCLAKVTDKDGKPVKVRYVKIKPEQTVG